MEHQALFVGGGSCARTSHGNADAATPVNGYLGIVHQKLIAKGVLAEIGRHLVFTQDYTFKKPSGAAAAVLGRTANGLIEWKRADGVLLGDVLRSNRVARARPLLDPVRHQILERHRELQSEGKLLTRQQLDRQYALFRERFGPAVLAGLDGEPLLNLMHDHGRKDSLVYWLEFKNDEEFQTTRFGSIAGGSALKFTIFRGKETGNWRAADKSNYPEDISVERAVEIARGHRDQLLKGVELLEAFPDNPVDEDYAELQEQMDVSAPDVSRLAWGHKYFSLLFPSLLDDYHSADYQRFYLLKLLQSPPEGEGRYLCAGRFVSAAKELGLPINHFTATLDAIHGRRHRYWRFASDASDKNSWPMMRQRGCVAVGGPRLGDLAWVEASQSHVSG